MVHTECDICFTPMQGAKWFIIGLLKNGGSKKGVLTYDTEAGAHKYWMALKQTQPKKMAKFNTYFVLPKI